MLASGHSSISNEDPMRCILKELPGPSGERPDSVFDGKERLIAIQTRNLVMEQEQKSRVVVSHKEL